MTAWWSSQRVADFLDGAEEVFTKDGDHPFLRLGDHDLPRLERFSQRNPVEVDVHAGSVARHLGERRREPCGTAVLERLDEPPLDELDRDLDQLLARERVADLHRRPLLGRALAELLAREHARAADAVPAGGRAVEDEQVPRRARLRARDPLGREQADAHRVDQAVVRVALVEERLAADGGDADAVAVVADPRHGAVERPARLAEAQAVEQCDRPRAHRNDVAEDSADAGRGALERFHRRRMVVALDLERDRLAVAEVEHPGVLAGTLEDALAFAREASEQQGGVLVAAVLGPEQREHCELEVVRVTSRQPADTVELPVREAERPVKRFRDLRQSKHGNREARRPLCSAAGQSPPARTELPPSAGQTPGDLLRWEG